jgi:hypothetical protein
MLNPIGARRRSTSPTNALTAALKLKRLSQSPNGNAEPSSSELQYQVVRHGDQSPTARQRLSFRVGPHPRTSQVSLTCTTFSPRLSQPAVPTITHSKAALGFFGLLQTGLCCKSPKRRCGCFLPRDETSDNRRSMQPRNRLRVLRAAAQSPTLLLDRRAYGSENLSPMPRKEFCNTINGDADRAGPNCMTFFA